MTTKTLNAMDEEVAALRADLAANPDPRQAKLDALLAMREIYLTKIMGFTTTFGNILHLGAGTTVTVIEPKALPNPEPEPDEEFFRRKSPETVAIIKGVQELLHLHQRPLTNIELVALLAERGIEVRGKNPANSLSAVLSNSNRFISGGRQGWRLVTAMDLMNPA